jgi:hypothetical protein
MRELGVLATVEDAMVAAEGLQRRIGRLCHVPRAMQT